MKKVTGKKIFGAWIIDPFKKEVIF